MYFDAFKGVSIYWHGLAQLGVSVMWILLNMYNFYKEYSDYVYFVGEERMQEIIPCSKTNNSAGSCFVTSEFLL